MPVPSSYNDITQSKEVRDHIGWAWYDRSFWVPKEWATNRRIFLRFGAAHYHAIVVRIKNKNIKKPIKTIFVPLLILIRVKFDEGDIYD